MAHKRKHIKVQIKVLDPLEPKKEDEEAEDSSEEDSSDSDSDEDETDGSSESEEDEDDDEGDEQPGKKQKLDDVLEAAPFVTYFATIKPERGEEQDLQFEVYASKDPDGREQQPMYLVSPQEGANLIGTTQPLPQTGVDQAKYVVGFFNRSKKTLKLVEAAGGSVVRLEAQAANVRDAQVAGLSTATEADEQQEQQRTLRPQDVAGRRAHSRKLVEAFGSTRRRRQLKQREEGAVVVDQNADEARLDLLMQEVAAKAAASGETRQKVMEKIGAARVVPAHNPQATQPHLAYRLSAMFPEQIMAALNVGQLLHAVEKSQDRKRLRDRQLVPPYILSRLQRVTDAADTKERKRRARILALLSALLQLAAARPVLKLLPPRPAKEEGGKEQPGGVEELARRLKIGRKDVLEPLLGMFYNRSTENDQVVYERDEHKRQLLLMHLLVVALDFEGWALGPLQFDGLREDLKMTPAEVVSRFRELGCICVSTKLPPRADADGTPVAAAASYTVRLLPDGKKTLAESFPKARTAPKQQKGR